MSFFINKKDKIIQPSKNILFLVRKINENTLLYQGWSTLKVDLLNYKHYRSFTPQRQRT